MRSRAIACIFLVFLVVLARPSRAVPPDPAARGLDVFVHMAPSAAPGRAVEVDVLALGFPEVMRAVPLAGAEIEAGWDPDTLGEREAPPTVKSTSDAEGRARVAVVMPNVEADEIHLLVGIRHGPHARTRTFSVRRAASGTVDLHVADRRVVPRSTISAWVRVAGVDGAPLASRDVVVSLVEAGVARWKSRMKTDAGGIVIARVPIPHVNEPEWQWTLQAVADVPGARPVEISLVPREETPGKPTLEPAWTIPPSGVHPGDTTPFAIRLRDATGRPIASHELRYWIGPAGTTPPRTDEAWEKSSILAKTDGLGVVRGERMAPTLVKAGGTAMILATRAEVEGHVLVEESRVDVGSPSSASVTILPEARSLVPGVAQRLLVRVTDARDEGVKGKFEIAGDGLRAVVTTDERGEAEITWTPPDGVGANRDVGPCAGGVAAAVTARPTEAIPALRGRSSLTTCVSVDREAAGIARVEPDVARPGERVRVTVTRRVPDRRAASVVAAARSSASSIATWLPADSGEIVLPEDASPGPWDVTVAIPDTKRDSIVLGTSLLVVPRLAPVLVAKRVGGRATPGGSVVIEARITDGFGNGARGAVSALVVDAFGGGDANVAALDTRHRLCSAVGVPSDRCDAVIAAASETEPLRRSLFGVAHPSHSPANDPGGAIDAAMQHAFAEVVQSLEGAVFEATQYPDRLEDVRRKQNGRWVMNPELFTLATDAMERAPLTPGGEPLTLPDLVAIDPQVTFDSVARRITRLKLFRLLAAVRDVRVKQSLDPDEPVFKDPNALLRRMVRDGTLADHALLDPWGGTIQFVNANATLPPFLGTVRGYELRSPGPDGRMGTADDVRDPFERVLRSKTPYAEAVQEDRLVDAKWDMVVSEPTVQNWDTLFTELTGTVLGRGEGIGLGGYGTGAGGSGLGVGAGHGRVTTGITTRSGAWLPPVRTDADGRVRITVPLGDVETTWRIALVGVPDGAGPATTTIDVASDVPVSARIDAGARWVDGDVVDAEIVVRNRTSEARDVLVKMRGEGMAVVEGKGEARVRVSAHGSSTLRTRVRATRAGQAALVVTTHADGVPDDTVRHSWEVVPKGERRIFTRSRWTSGKSHLELALDHGYALDGGPRLVLERGFDDAVAGALDALEPERQTSAASLADAAEAAARIEQWARTRPTPRHQALAEIASGMKKRAHARHAAFAKLDETSPIKRANVWTTRERMRKTGECPPEDEEALDVEPAPKPDVKPCWGAYVANAGRFLATSKDAPLLARAVLATAERPHRAALATQLAERLGAVVKLDASGEIDGVVDRADRAVVYAALLRASELGTSAASGPTLFSKLSALRDANGGYGSSAATLAVVRALLASQLEGRGTTRVRVAGRVVDVPASGSVVVPLPADTLAVTVETDGPGVMARLERPVLRLWSHPPPQAAGDVGLDVVWPSDARARSVGTVRVAVQNALEHDVEVDVRIPLPPGASLAAKVNGASQMQGVLLLRTPVPSTGTIVELPVRFALSGTMTVPEATARHARSTSAFATAPARVLQVR